MQELTLKIPANVLKELDLEREEQLVEIFVEGLKRFKIKRALKLYQNSSISFGRAAELAKVREDELAMEAYAQGIEPLYDKKTLEEELE